MFISSFLRTFTRNHLKQFENKTFRHPYLQMKWTQSSFKQCLAHISWYMYILFIDGLLIIAYTLRHSIRVPDDRELIIISPHESNQPRGCFPYGNIHLTSRNPLGPLLIIYRQISNTRLSLLGNTIVDHSDVVGASSVGVALTTSSFIDLT